LKNVVFRCTKYTVIFKSTYSLFDFYGTILKTGVSALKIVCLGDSNTYGYDPRGYISGQYPKENQWPHLLALQTGHDCFNAGSNGRQTKLDSYTQRWLQAQPDAELLLIMLGTNDLLQGASAKETAMQMEACLISLRPHWKQILLISPPPMKRGSWVINDSRVEESLRLAEEYRELANKLQISFVDTRFWDIELAFDGVHFTQEGHRAFADQLAKHIP
jgi:lysophospholipase L1-like esterase